MKKSIKYGFIGLFIGVLIGLIPFFSLIDTTTFLGSIMVFIIDPVSLIIGGEGHPPLSIFFSPILYALIGFLIGHYIVGRKK